MKRSKKMTVLLILCLLLAGSGGYYWLEICQGRQMEVLRKELRQKEQEYAENEAFAAQFDAFRDSLNVLRTAYNASDKVILPHEDSKVSLEYFNDLVEEGGSDVNFTFQAGAHQAFDQYNQTSYILEGDASFGQLYGLLWKLERYKRLYTIQAITLNEIKKTASKNESPQSMVRFGISLTGYSAKDTLREEKAIRENVALSAVEHNPFLPVVQEFIPPNKDNLFDITDATLQGMTDDRAFVADKRGRFESLKEGDRVYLGYLTKIDKRNGLVEFTLNKGGFMEKAVLRLKK